MQKLVNGCEWEISRKDTFTLPFVIQNHELAEGEKFVFTVRKIEKPYYNSEELGDILFQREITDVETEDGNSSFTISASLEEAYAMPVGRHAWDMALVDTVNDTELEILSPSRFEIYEVLR